MRSIRALLFVFLALLGAAASFGACGHVASEGPTRSDAGADSDATDETIDGCVLAGGAICPRGANTGQIICPAGDGCNYCTCSATGVPESRACSTRPCAEDASPVAHGCPGTRPSVGAPCEPVGTNCWYLADSGGCVRPACMGSGWVVGPTDPSCR